MKTINKVLIGLATATTILSPLVPKNLNININVEPPAIVATKSVPYTTLTTKCDLVNKSTTETGMQVCEYKCRDGDKVTVYKTFRTNAAFCSETITEKVKQTKR